MLLHLDITQNFYFTTIPHDAADGQFNCIGDFFKQKCSGYTGYIFTGNPSLAKKVGLRTNRRFEFYNASIECRLLKYELYTGTKKKKA